MTTMMTSATRLSVISPLWQNLLVFDSFSWFSNPTLANILQTNNVVNGPKIAKII